MVVKIDVINIGDIPPRTVVSFDYLEVDNLGALIIGGESQTIDASKSPRTYKCIDCGHTTDNVTDMKIHQALQEGHTLWQRFKRWWA